MANITNIIGGQPYLDAATGNMKNKLLNFWKGTQAQYDALKQTSATTASNPAAVSSVDFTVTSSSAFTVGDIVYVTGSLFNFEEGDGINVPYSGNKRANFYVNNLGIQIYTSSAV